MSSNQISCIKTTGKKIGKLLTVFILSFLLINKTLKAQNNDPTVYIAINYVKTLPGKTSAYEKLLSTYSKSLNEEYFKSGKILGWYTNNVLMPTGSSAAYDMTIVTVSTDMSLLIDDTTSLIERFKKVVPGASNETIQMIFDAYAGSRSLVKREIYSFIDGIQLNTKNSPYAQVDFMKATPGKESEYVKLEKDIYKPLHTEMVKKGGRDDWGFYAVEMPYFADREYDYITANFFTSLNQGKGISYSEIAKKVFPKMDMNTLFTQTTNARKMVRSEVWKLGVFVDGTNTKK